MSASLRKAVPEVPRPQSAANSLQPMLLNIPEAAALAGLTIWQIRGLIATGELKIVRVGRKFYVRRATLLRWAELAEGVAA